MHGTSPSFRRAPGGRRQSDDPLRRSRDQREDFHRDRQARQKRLSVEGIQTGVHYPVAAHLQRAYEALRHREGGFPVTERSARERLSLPIYPEQPDADVERVCEVIRDWIG